VTPLINRGQARRTARLPLDGDEGAVGERLLGVDFLIRLVEPYELVAVTLSMPKFSNEQDRVQAAANNREGALVR